MLLTEVSFVFLVYSTLWYFKKLYQKKWLVLYFLSGILFWTLYLIARIQFQKNYLISVKYIASMDWKDIFIDSITQHIITFFIITMLKYLKDNYINQYHEKIKKAYQIESELRNLKEQISPHFLFNTMNNFYGLAVENSKKLPDLMIRLSDLLRYSLYETKNEKVSLTAEINYLKNYIELEKIRLEDNLKVDFSTEILIDKDYKIAPLLLIIFIENAFKHARNSQNEPIHIIISIAVSKKDIFTLTVKNNYQHNLILNPLEIGIGLENAKKRLEVLYPSHNLIIKKDKKDYLVSLILNLN